VKFKSWVMILFILIFFVIKELVVSAKVSLVRRGFI